MLMKGQCTDGKSENDISFSAHRVQSDQKLNLPYSYVASVPQTPAGRI